MKSSFHVLLSAVAVSALLFLTGCDDGGGQVASPQLDSSNDTGMNSGSGEEEMIRDTVFRVVEKRQQGGQLQASGDVSAFDGNPRMTRAPVEYMIIVEGDQTRQQSAYLLPDSDYRTVQVGQGLRESTLGRWESTSTDHIPPPPPPPESPLRSRTGGAAENLVY